MGGKYPGEKRETWPRVEPADNTEAPVGPRRDRVLGRYVTSHLDGRQVSRVVYGSIIGLALVVGLEAHPPGAGAVIATLLGTALAVGLAELYSELVGLEVRGHRRAIGAERRHLLADVGAVIFGIAFPAVFFLLAAVGAFEEDAAFTIAKWTGLGLIGFYGFVGARVSGSSLLASLAQASAVAVIGGLLIAFKALVH